AVGCGSGGGPGAGGRGLGDGLFGAVAERGRGGSRDRRVGRAVEPAARGHSGREGWATRAHAVVGVRVTLSDDERFLDVDFEGPRRTLSWAILGGGFGVHRKVVWHFVSRAELTPEVDPVQLFR